MAGQGTTAATSDTTIMPMLAVGTSSGSIFLISVATLQVLLVWDELSAVHMLACPVWEVMVVGACLLHGLHGRPIYTFNT